MTQVVLEEPQKPQYLNGLALLFWGYQSDLIWFAIPMAIIAEARYYFNRRWALEKADFYRVADLTSIGLVAMVIFLFLNAREYHFITTLISWLPILFYPLTTVIGYSTTQRMPLDVLFYSLRRQREPVTQSWDMDYVLFALCIMAAGLNRENSLFFIVAATLILLALYQLRSPRFHKSVFILAMCLVLISASFLQQGIRGTHLAMKAQTQQWIANWISNRIDPHKTRTALGQVGKFKLSDAIAFRIAPASGEKDFPLYLQEASYNLPGITDWSAHTALPEPVEHADDYRWEFTQLPVTRFPEAKIYKEFSRETAVIPVPSELMELNELAAEQIKMSQYGTIVGHDLIPAPHYKVRFAPTGNLASPPNDTDLVVPPEYIDTFNKLIPSDIPKDRAVPFIHEFFTDFRYTLYQSAGRIQLNPLEYFLTERRAGHCEYFASATALLLRHMGIPTRYVVGFSVQEWNDSLKMYIVRERHAHAWVQAYVDGKWIVVDTTPNQWLSLEESASSSLQPIWDFLSNNRFQFQLWWTEQKIEDYERELYIIGALLVLFLVWRISTSEQVIIEDQMAESALTHDWLGQESPFFDIEEHLSEQGLRRGSGELMSQWLVRVGHPELLPMLTSHNRWRFDPYGISIEERERLVKQVAEWLQQRSDDQLATGVTS